MKKEIRNILFPIDFSACAINALKYTAELAKVHGANILILYVHSEQDGMSIEEAKNKLYALKDLPFLKGVIHHFIVKEGDVLDNIIKLSNENTDLIAMGTLGSGKIRKDIGSNASNVIEKSVLPVLVIPEVATFMLKKVLYATNMEGMNLMQVNHLIDIIKPFESELSFLFVDTQHQVTSHEDFSNAVKKLRNYVSYRKVAGFVSSSPDVEEGIDLFIRRNSIDLLTLSTYQSSFVRSINESLTQKFAFFSEIPVLALHIRQI